MQRLTAIRKVRALIEPWRRVLWRRPGFPRGAVPGTRSLAQWGRPLERPAPVRTERHPSAGDVADAAVEASAPPPSHGAVPAVGSLPPELLQKAILLAGELVSSSVREDILSDQPVGMRLQVLPRAIRIELSEVRMVRGYPARANSRRRRGSSSSCPRTSSAQQAELASTSAHNPALPCHPPRRRLPPQVRAVPAGPGGQPIPDGSLPPAPVRRAAAATRSRARCG